MTGGQGGRLGRRGILVGGAGLVALGVLGADSNVAGDDWGGAVVSDEVTGWLASNALALSGVAAGIPNEDLQPLTGLFRDVRLVGMGEATHGTREFFQLKHRLLESLVTEMGFSAFAMEASASAAPAVDAYVRHGVGNGAEVLAGLGFWTWRTSEVLSMIEWMRAYNRGRPEGARLRFVGIDPQRAAGSVSALDAYLSINAPDRVAGFRTTLSVLATVLPGSFPAPREHLMREAEHLVAFLRVQDPVPVEAIRHARILVEAADLATRPRQHADPKQTVFAARDRYMADAVGELLDDPAAKVVLWAHNTHIAKRGTDDAVATLGQHLHQRFGDAYYALGLLFGKGRFRARKSRLGPWDSADSRPAAENSVGSPAPTAVEAYLAAATPTHHLIDLRAAAYAPPAVSQWLNDRNLMRSFGAQVPRWTYRSSQTPTVLAREYDGLAYVPISTCSRPLPA